MDLQVSVADILMIIDGHARQVQGALAQPQNLDTNALKSHVARMYAYADKLHEIAEKARVEAQKNGEATGVAN
jgi:hypothetical protein